MTDENELKRLDKALEDQRDALQASIDAAYKFGLKRGSQQQRARSMRWLKENSAHYAGNISYSNYELFMETLVVAFEKAMRPTTTQEEL